MITDRFEKIRKISLEKIFTKNFIVYVWKKIVKDQLRRFDIKDLYDFYDYSYNIEERAQELRTSLLNANYQVSKPLIFRIEKKLGICRHIVFPNPMDALTLQIITETLSKEIIKNQPSKNTFYSRDKHNVFRAHEVDDYGLNIFQLWKKLQKQIYKFNEEKLLLVVTDLSNYYDSIDIEQIKKVITGYIDGNEVLIDLLFKIVEDISWTPDYLPYSNKGLPTTNLEGIRLLAHSFLFEFDSILKGKTNNSFARWMDDVTIGVDSRVEAIETISAASDVLKSRGLALNIAKTHIYTHNEAKVHFQIDENKYLDSIDFQLEDKILRKQTIEVLYKNLKIHLKNTSPKYWDKITKRYITSFTKFRSTKILKLLLNLYVEFPSLRPNLIVYLEKLNYSYTRSLVVLDICKQTGIYDDISLFQICELVTNWEIEKSAKSKIFLNSFEKFLFSVSTKRKTYFDFYCIIWFKAKYRNSDNIYSFINKYENLWKGSPFVRRQTIASLSRLLVTHLVETRRILRSEIFSGNIQTVPLSNQILKFAKLEFYDSNIKNYLFPPNIQRPYPLSKFLILCNILSSERIRSSRNITKLIKENIYDPYYLHWLNSQYHIDI